MFNLLSNAISISNTWNAWQTNKNNIKRAKQAIKLQRTLAAESLAVTYNSILRKASEVSAQAARQAEGVRIAERQAEGSAVAAAAATGAAGKRVTLARNMAIQGGAERQLTQLEIDTKNEIDALSDRADTEARALTNQLINNQQYVPQDQSGAIAISGATELLGLYNQKTAREDELQAMVEAGTGVQTAL